MGWGLERKCGQLTNEEVLACAKVSHREVRRLAMHTQIMQDLIEMLRQSRHGTKERLSVYEQFAIVFCSGASGGSPCLPSR